MVMEKESITASQMDDILNKKSGILGVTGKYTDRRDVQQAAEAGDARAQLAVDIESYRIKKYIGAYSAAIGGADAIVFTAGVGEMSELIREKSLEGLEFMGIKLDKAKNNLAKTRNAETEISTSDSKVKVFVIPTDEERVNIEDVVAIIDGTYDEHTRFTYHFQLPALRERSARTGFPEGVRKKTGSQGHSGKAQKVGGFPVEDKAPERARASLPVGFLFMVGNKSLIRPTRKLSDCQLKNRRSSIWGKASPRFSPIPLRRRSGSLLRCVVRAPRRTVEYVCGSLGRAP